MRIQASEAAAEAATDGWDVESRGCRARDRSFYPLSGSGVSFAVGGAHGREREATETAGVLREHQGRKGVK